MNMETKATLRLELPPLFYDYCISEGLTSGREQSRNSRSVRVEMTQAEVEGLYALALRYGAVGDFEAELQGVCFSARATCNRMALQSPGLSATVDAGPAEEVQSFESELPPGEWVNGRQRLESYGGFIKGDTVRRPGERGVYIVQYIDVFEKDRPAEITAVGGMAGHKQFAVFFINKVNRVRPIKGQKEGK